MSSRIDVFATWFAFLCIRNVSSLEVKKETKWYSLAVCIEFSYCIAGSTLSGDSFDMQMLSRMRKPEDAGSAIDGFHTCLHGHA